MPSWNIHIAHVEHLLEGGRAGKLGIADENAFLFGNFVPDVYVGFMVPDATMRIDYCITHAARPTLIPLPDADFFWNRYIVQRRPATTAGLSLALGAWAHLATDRFYNGSFRQYWASHDTPEGDELRRGKQGDFDLFGRTLGIRAHAEMTPGLLDATRDFHPYRILPDDVRRAIDVADAIVRKNASAPAGDIGFRLLTEEWLTSAFEACDERLGTWLSTWKELKNEGAACGAADVRARAGLSPAAPDNDDWLTTRSSNRSD